LCQTIKVFSIRFGATAGIGDRQPQRTQVEPVAYFRRRQTRGQTKKAGNKRSQSQEVGNQRVLEQTCFIIISSQEIQTHSLAQSLSRVFVLMQKVWANQNDHQRRGMLIRKSPRHCAVAYLYGNEIADINLISAHRIIRDARRSSCNKNKKCARREQGLRNQRH